MYESRGILRDGDGKVPVGILRFRCFAYCLRTSSAAFELRFDLDVATVLELDAIEHPEEPFAELSDELDMTFTS